MAHYDAEFFAGRHRRTVYAAQRILTVAREALPPVHSAVDLGCGVGTWLSVLAGSGVEDILGIDGDWVSRELLEIPAASFIASDLTAPIVLDRRFDLAISLEVAEHLPAASADSFVGSLVALSDFVLFSAAVPFQGGTHHVNEQWPGYWAARFRSAGYEPWDAIRHRVWEDREIPVWYRQNVLLFVRRDRIGDLSSLSIDVEAASAALARVHPEMFLGKIREWHSVRGSAGLLARALRRWVGQRLGQG